MSEPGGFLAGAERRRLLEEENERLRAKVAELQFILDKAEKRIAELEEANRRAAEWALQQP